MDNIISPLGELAALAWRRPTRVAYKQGTHARLSHDPLVNGQTMSAASMSIHLLLLQPSGVATMKMRAPMMMISSIANQPRKLLFTPTFCALRKGRSTSRQPASQQLY